MTSEKLSKLKSMAMGSDLIVKTPQQGISSVRLVYPRGSEDSIPFFEVRIHSGFLTLNKKTKETYQCVGGDCPFCRYAKKGNSSNAKKKEARTVFHYQAVHEQEFKVFEASWTLQRELVGFGIDANGAIIKALKADIDLMSIKDGRPIFIEVTKDEIGHTKYEVKGIGKISPVEEELIPILKQAPDIRAAYYRPNLHEAEDIVRWTHITLED